MEDAKRRTVTKAWRLGIRERRWLLIAGDFLLACVALTFALYYWAAGIDIGNVREAFEFLQLRPPSWFYFLPLFWVVLLVETYNPHRASNWRQTLTGLATAALIGMSIYFIFYFASAPGSLPRRGVASFAVTAWFLTAVWRLLYIRIFTSPQFTRRAILVGAGISGQALLNVINSITPMPYQILGILDDDPQTKGRKMSNQPVLGNSELLLPLMEQQ